MDYGLNQNVEIIMPHSNTFTVTTGYSFVGFEAKLSYILEHEEELPDDHLLVDFFMNHFIMSDLDIRQLKAYITYQGMPSFLNLIAQLSAKVTH
ncbi:MAG TPA: hypothetical protein PKL31_09320 [Fulvivirga sp.]|nr:hypothetical protein [Fulvivirga sp.]